MQIFELSTPQGFPLADAGIDLIICDDNSLVLEANMPASTHGQWTVLGIGPEILSPNSPSTAVLGLLPGQNKFVWTLSHSNCLDYHSDTIRIDLIPSPVGIPEDYEIEGTPTMLSVDVLDNEKVTYPYDELIINLFDTQSGIINYDEAGQIDLDLQVLSESPEAIVYQYEVCNATLCPLLCDTTFFRLTPNLANSISIPNGFTPNGDGLNDTFEIPALDIPDRYQNNELVIFNRWGDVVFRASPYLNNWNGTNNNGKILPIGTYFYRLQLNLNEGKVITGDITILR